MRTFRKKFPVKRRRESLNSFSNVIDRDIHLLPLLRLIFPICENRYVRLGLSARFASECRIFSSNNHPVFNYLSP